MASSLILTGGAATTKTLKEEIAQTAHGFTVGSVLRWDYSQGKYALAKADTALNAEVVGVVNELSDANNFYLTYSGYIEIPTFSGGSYPVLFLSGTTAGELSSSPPSFVGSVVKPVLSRSTNGAGHIVMNYLGTQIGGSSTVAIDEIQPVGSVMPFAGDAIPDTWLECNGAAYAVSDYAELYEKLRFVSGDRVPLYGYITQISVNTTTYSTWFSSVSVGDKIVYSPTQSNLTQNVVTQYSLQGKVIAKGSGNITVQVYPTYSSRNFIFQNVIPSSVGWIAAFAPGTYFYEPLTSTNRRGNAAGQPTAAVGAASVTHFNTPDLRARFPIGVNTSAIGEDEGDTTYNSALSAFGLGEQGGSESLGTIINVATWNATSAESAVPSGSAVIKPPYLATKYIIKAKPYTRAAIVDGLDIPYSQLLVRDLRSRNVGGSNGDLVFYTNTAGDSGSGTERMRINSSGRVGIGNFETNYTNSSYIMQVSGSAGGNSGIAINLSQNAAPYGLGFGSVAADSGSGSGPTTYATLYCAANRNYNLSAFALGFQNSASVNSGSGFTPLLIGFNDSSRIGIGITAPGASLDVNGTLKVGNFGGGTNVMPKATNANGTVGQIVPLFTWGAGIGSATFQRNHTAPIPSGTWLVVLNGQSDSISGDGENASLVMAQTWVVPSGKYLVFAHSDLYTTFSSNTTSGLAWREINASDVGLYRTATNDFPPAQITSANGWNNISKSNGTAQLINEQNADTATGGDKQASGCVYQGGGGWFVTSQVQGYAIRIA